MKHELIQKKLRELETIIDSPLGPKRKIHALKELERLLSRQNGITLMALKEIENVAHKAGISETQRIDELRALETVFVEGAMKTAKEAGNGLTRKQAREIFEGYARQHAKMKLWGIRHRQIARELTRKRRPARGILPKRPK